MALDGITLGIFLIILSIVLPLFYYIFKAHNNKDLFVRRINGIDAIEEVIGRSAELGRPISFTTGLTQLGPVLYACLGTLYYVAKKAARYKSKLIVPQTQPDVMAVSEEVVKDAYRESGKLSLFDSRNIPYLSDEQFAFTAGYIGIIQRENIGGAFLFGHFAAESLVLAEAGQQVGAMQVAATTSPEQVAFFISACDYTLIGEELFAASAYLTREPVQLGSLYGQDRAKMLFFLLIIAGVTIATINSISPDFIKFSIVDFIYKKQWTGE